MSLPVPDVAADSAPALGRELLNMRRAGISRPTLIPICGSYMEPTLSRGDFVMAVPADRYVCAGLYVIQSLGKAVVCRADARPEGGVWWRFDAFEPHVSPREKFDAMVLGYVCATVDVIDGDTLATGLPPVPLTPRDLGIGVRA